MFDPELFTSKAIGPTLPPNGFAAAKAVSLIPFVAKGLKSPLKSQLNLIEIKKVSHIYN